MSQSQTARNSSRAARTARGILAGAALLLPTMSLLPLGGLYLWEHGLVVWWAAGALAVVALVSVALRVLLPDPGRTPAIEIERPVDAAASAHYSDTEQAAWNDVVAIAARVDVERITSADYVTALGQQTLEAVARRLHPEKGDAIWQFTLPEALAINERVSRRLGTFIVDNVPFGDRLTVAQVLAAYRWRGAFDVAERAYDIWRVLRLVNPAAAATNEARERLSRAVYNYGKEHVSRSIAQAYVEEVGRAAIDLYGGRLAVVQKLSTNENVGDPYEQLAARRVAVSVVVGGSSRADRLAVATLLGDLARERRIDAGEPAGALSPTVLAEPVALDAADTDIAGAIGQLDRADIVVWIAQQENVNRDMAILSGLRGGIARDNDRAMPVFLPVQLRAGAVEGSAKADAAAAVDDLARAFGVATPATVEVGNLDLAALDAVRDLLSAIDAKLPHARRVSVLRAMAQMKPRQGWTQSARQALKAANSLARATSRKPR